MVILKCVDSMDKSERTFQIKDLLKITQNNKYETCVAAFEVVENFHKMDLDLKKLGWKTNKVAVIAMMALSKGIVKYGYITDEQRQKLEQELKEKTTNIHLQKAESLFKKNKKVLEVSEDLNEEDVGETIKEDLSSLEEESPYEEKETSFYEDMDNETYEEDEELDEEEDE
ncbi:MAG: hypothetical protein ACK4UJ_10350 [Leptonema sp. (in: bacteria)]